MGTADIAIQARVRQALARRWVRIDQLEIGVTEGVVLLRGCLDVEPGGAPEGDAPPACARLARRIERELRSLPGVLDVVMDIQHAPECARKGA